MKKIKDFEKVLNGELYLEELKCDGDLFYGMSLRTKTSLSIRILAAQTIFAMRGLWLTVWCLALTRFSSVTSAEPMTLPSFTHGVARLPDSPKLTLNGIKERMF